MSTTISDAMGTAKEVLGTAKGGAEHAASSARSTIFDIAKFAVGVATTLRGFGVDDALGFVGLARKRSMLSSIGILGAGIVVGAGVGVLLAPMSGRQLRRAMLQGLDELKNDAGQKLDKVGDDVKELEQKVEKKVDAAADVVKSKVDAAEGTVKEALSDVKSAASSVKNSWSTNGDEIKSAKSHSSSERGRPLS
jgi:gas vesicle protein